MLLFMECPNGEMVDAIDSKSIMVTCKSSSLFWGSILGV